MRKICFSTLAIVLMWSLIPGVSVWGEDLREVPGTVKGDLEGPDYLQPPANYRTCEMLLAQAGITESGIKAPGPPPVPVSGTRELLVILVEFSDVTPDPAHTVAHFHDRFFDTAPPSVRDYYDEVSYGSFTYVPGATMGWYHSTHPQSHWTGPGSDPRPVVVEAIQDVDPFFNFAPHDTDTNGMVTNDELTIFIIVTGSLGGAFHWWTAGSVATADGVSVEGEFSATHENRHIGSYCHELGHDLGLPDLYDTDGGSEGIGNYGLMGGGSWTFSHMTAWSKIQFGWITPTVVTASGYYDVHDAETNAEAYVLVDPAHSTDEYFLIENRHPTNSYYESIGPPIAPSGTFPDQGIVIYHINETRIQDWINSGTNNVNVDETLKGVDVECADSPTSHFIDADDLDAEVNRGDSDDLWDMDEYDFNDTSTPCNASWYSGAPSGMDVSEFPSSSSTMKVYLSVRRKSAYVYCTWGMRTMQTEMNHLHSLDPGKYSFDWYNDANIADLWGNLGKYKALLIDEDTFYEDWSWSRYGGPIYNSFRTHASDLETFVQNGGGIFTSGENDLYRTQAWDWLPPGMQATSFDPEHTSNVYIVFDPGSPNGLYSYPNTITDSYLSRGHTHAWFTSWDSGYTVTVRRTDNDMAIELYGVFGKGCIVVSHVEAESISNAWEYMQNQLDFIVPPTTYTMTVLSPTEDSIFKVGDTVLFEVAITDMFGNPGTGATVTVNSPAGAPISLTETPPGSGIYVGTYVILPTDPVGTWAVSFVASIEGEFPKQTVPVIIPADSTPPTITVEIPSEGQAVQDGVTLTARASDPSGVDWVTFSIREPNGLLGTMINPMFESMPATHAGDNTWELPFDSTQLPDGYYLLVVNASDTLGNEGFATRGFSIRNWACIELLPASENNKAGRTMPVKFSLRVVEAVDPAQPFVWNEELTIVIYEEDHPENILQESTYGDTARDYRIDPIGELYITNFRTLKRNITTYVIEVCRKDLLIGSFGFTAVK